MAKKTKKHKNEIQEKAKNRKKRKTKKDRGGKKKKSSVLKAEGVWTRNRARSNYIGAKDARKLHSKLKYRTNQ